jgi:uncharacterized protein YbaR (Trm112 family)
MLKTAFPDDEDQKRKKDAKFLLVEYLEVAETLPRTSEMNLLSQDMSLLRPQPWIPDTDVLACQSCNRPFSFFHRRHHCRLCGKIFCATCSDKRLNLENILTDLRISPHLQGLARLCQPCYNELSARQSDSNTSLPQNPEQNESANNGFERASIPRSESVNSLGSLVECPACLKPLNQFATRSEREVHVSCCLSTPIVNTQARFTVQKWKTQPEKGLQSHFAGTSERVEEPGTSSTSFPSDGMSLTSSNSEFARRFVNFTECLASF